MLCTSNCDNLNDNAKFLFKLFGPIFRKNYTENMVISPKSIEMSMGLVLFPAAKETAQEIRDFLKLKSQDDFENACYFHEFFANCRTESIMKVALNIFPSIQYQLRPQLQEIFKTAFRAVPEYIDFEKNKLAATHINCWALYETNGRIKDMVKCTSFQKDTSMVLVSAVYLKASWRIPFDPKRTKHGRFFVYEGMSIPVYMMSVSGEFRTKDCPEYEASVIELEFDHSDITMVIFMPNSQRGMKGISHMIEGGKVFQIIDELQPEIIQVRMPRFKAEFGTELTDHIRGLGLRSIFSPTADFSDLLIHSQNVKVSNIFQKVLIEINEYGAQAEPSEKSRNKKICAEKKFIINRPFFYIIRDKKTIYFMGYLAQPIKKTKC